MLCLPCFEPVVKGGRGLWTTHGCGGRGNEDAAGGHKSFLMAVAGMGFTPG